MKKLILSLLVTTAFSAIAFADVRLPDAPTPTPKAGKSIDANLQIKLDPNAKDARLIVPKSQLKALRAQLDEIDAADDTAAVSSVSRTQTIISGTFLCLAFVFGGVWLIRSRGNSTPGKGAAAVAILAAVGALATVAFANIGPPLDARKITGKLFSDAVHSYKQASGPIKLETADNQSSVVLIVPDPKDESVKPIE